MNYLTLSRTFGNVREKSIRKVIESIDFRKKWYIPNSEILNARSVLSILLCKLLRCG